MKVKQFLAGTLIFALCGAPELIKAQQSPSSGTSPAATQTEAEAQAQPAAPVAKDSPQSSPQLSAVSGVSVDPARGPLQPVPAEVPAEPAAQTRTPQTSTDSSFQGQPPTDQTAAQTLPQNPEPQLPSEPVGAAAAQQAPTAGGVASKPAGTAIAPAKQRQVRSWLIRVGAIAAAGAALGTVFALSRRTPSTPPGAQTLGAH